MIFAVIHEKKNTNMDIKRIIREEITNVLKDNSANNSYNIVTYFPKLNETDNEFLKRNRKILWDFMNVGYRYAGLGDFRGCANDRALYKNASCLRIGYHNDTMIALAVYTSYQQGFKGVGYTVTTDETLRELGKKCLNEIIKIDISAEKQYFWSICSGSIEHLWDKFGGTKIPNTFASEYLPIAGISKVLDDGFSIVITDKNGNEEKKVIFGYNSEETFNKVVSFMEKGVSDSLKDNIDESSEIDVMAKILYRQLSVYIELVYVDGWSDIPESCLEHLKKLLGACCALLDSVKLDKNSNSPVNILAMNVETCKSMIEDGDVKPLIMNKF